MNNLAQSNPAVVTSLLTFPPGCPKCASHGTEAVGRSNDDRTIAIGFQTRDRLLKMTPDDDRAAEADDVTPELEAIFTVGKALARLHNPDARRRVLNWAVERFNVEPDAHVEAPAAPASDRALDVEGLNDLFDSPDRSPLRSSDGLDDPLDDLFDVPAPSPHEELPPPVRDRPRVNVLFPAFAAFLSAFRRFALGVGVGSPDTVSAIGQR